MILNTQNGRMSVMGWQTFSLPKADGSISYPDRLMYVGEPAVGVGPPIGTSGEMTEQITFGNFGDFGSMP
jgi:hypothetical protein